MEGYERPKVPERNVAEDKNAFLEGIAAARIEEISTNYDEHAVAALTENLKETNVFVIGETHGVRENASIIYTLFKKFGFKNLALEWDDRRHESAMQFLEGGDLDFDAIQDSPDGRITPEHFALLRKLKEEGLLGSLICFDWGPIQDQLNDRDANMARHLLENSSDEPMLVVGGSWHTQTRPVAQEEGDYHPMGELLKKEIPDIATGKIEYGAGQYYNFGAKDFGVSAARTDAEPRFLRLEDGRYIYELPLAHAAIVPNPHERL